MAGEETHLPRFAQPAHANDLLTSFSTFPKVAHSLVPAHVPLVDTSASLLKDRHHVLSFAPHDHEEMSSTRCEREERDGASCR